MTIETKLRQPVPNFPTEIGLFLDCLEVVEEIHHLTRETLAKLTDADLEKTFVRVREDGETHYSLRWIFVHLLEHEAEHKGQMMMIKRLVKEGKR